MKKLYLISGKAESGKNTVADIMSEEYTKQGSKCLTIAYGDDLKHIAKTYFGWDGKKDEVGRTLLQYVGTDLVRVKMKQPNYWVYRVMDIVDMIEDNYDYIFIPDCRFVNEVEIPIHKHTHKCTSIRVERPNHKSTLTKEQLTHPSETSLDNFRFQEYIYNDGDLENLRNKIQKLLINKETNNLIYNQLLKLREFRHKFNK